MTSTRTATVSACLNLEEVSLRSSWSEKVRTRRIENEACHENCICNVLIQKVFVFHTGQFLLLFSIVKE